MGRFNDVLVAAGLKLPVPTEVPHAPYDVRVTINGLRVHVVVLQDHVNPCRYIAYGPTVMPAFDSQPTVWAQTHPDTTLELALTLDTAGEYRFAPMPAVVERPAARVAG